MKRYRRQAADQRLPTPGRATSYDLAVMLTPWMSPWLKLGEMRFEFVKFESSSELKTEASNIRTSFNIPTNCVNDNRPIPIIGRLSVHL